MGAIASLENALVTATPGSESSVEIKIRNNGSVVDLMTLSVLGEAAAWSSIEPPSLSLFPGAEGTASLTFRPPRDSSIPAGRMAFGVRVASQEDPAGSVVEEGRLEIAPFHDVSAELQPRTSRGSRGARHDIAIDNRGNVPLNATISGTDADQALGFDIDPPSVVTDPGQVSFARVEVKTRKRFWRGQPQTRTFMLQVEPSGAPPVPVDGSLLQEPMLPPWFVKALVALAAIVVALAALWFLVLQPSVLTAAETRAEEVLQDAGIEVAPDGGGGTDGGGGGGGGGGDTSPPAVATGDPVDGRLRANQDSIVPNEGRSLFVTDLIFSNPGAETGPLRLQRNGETLLEMRLENFRDLDFHFITPIRFGPDDQMTLECPGCRNAGVFYSGYER